MRPKIVTMRAVSLIALTVLLFSCQNVDCRQAPTDTLERVDISFERMEPALFQTKNAAEAKEFLEQNPAIAVGLLHSNEYPDLNILSNRLADLIRDPFIDTLYDEAVAAYADYGPQFEEEMVTAFSYLKYYYPQAPVPDFQTMVTGLYNDVMISDSLILLSIDFFIGEQASYRPLDMPQYILRRYSGEYLAPTIMKYYLDSFAATGKENTLLSEMIDYGKLYYFIGKIMPCVEDWRIMGYTQKEIEDSKENREIIWANFVENQILYDTSEEMKRRFLGERPNVYEIGEACPGRIGTWIGWEIVQAYAEQTGATLQEIMAETDHHKIFSMSKYKPVNE